ncbi:MAG: hypothetical protein WBJ37_09655 [Bacteroidales bacterium]
MNAYLVILAQSVTTAAIEIILLLLCAGVVGFLSAWFYQKAYFTPIIRKLEEEKEQLNRRIEELNSEISGLKSKISGLENLLAEKEREIQEFKNQMKKEG